MPNVDYFHENMGSIIVLAALGGLAATTTTAVATGDASTLANAVYAVPPGLHVALSHVPSTSHAYDVLKEHLSLYAQAGGSGTAAGGAGASIMHGLHLGLGK
jgi:hypothetical protein